MKGKIKVSGTFKKKRNNGMVMVWIAVYLGLFVFGIVVGMMIQQAIFKQGIIDVLSYTDVEVNINMNETKLVQELNNTFIPAWKEAFNQTTYEQLDVRGAIKNCTRDFNIYYAIRR